MSPAVEDAVARALLIIDELAHPVRHGAPPASLHSGDEEERWIVTVTDSASHRLHRLPHSAGRPAGGGGYGHYVADLTATHGVHRDHDRKSGWVRLTKPS
ncbi:protein of unknown function [Modestobacter italicus]|uniref:ATP-binding protein n=1 Tax=Modestobacter italicus (strain DSM 44449 / CECT 9708 / BC 501) TaxID=2732864 RepID=I4F0K8_MODI5|nr:hypothetical protein [Modestobacter marinus]CCH89171.1 protein of unknown function [Modestobacter marinus]